MINPIYKFYLRLGKAGAETPVNPIYKDDVTLDYEKEASNRFFRAKLNGKFTFLRADYDLIMGAQFDTIYMLVVKISHDLGRSWYNYWEGKFMRTDCTIDPTDKSITVQPSTIDAYTDVLAGMEKEYNLIELAPEVDSVLITKRPLIQVYKLGDKVVSCFLSGSTWEQDVSEACDNADKMINKYHFALAHKAVEVSITEATDPAYNGVYVCDEAVESGDRTVYTCKRKDDNNYIVTITALKDAAYFGAIGSIVLSRGNSGYSAVVGNATDKNNEYTLTAFNGGTGYAKAYVNVIQIFMRLLLDKPKISNLKTYEIPAEDLVDNNRNYRYGIGYKMGNIVVSLDSTDKATEYGKRDDGRYFQMPYITGVGKFFPVAKSTWLTASVWFHFNFYDEWSEYEGRTSYLLRDAYELGSCINVLLKQFSDVTFDSNENGSKFLYAQNNPINNVKQRLFITQKSNILIGEYQEPAKKAICTLQSIFNMLRDVFRCYWYIDDNKKLHIEHVKYFNNGGSYDSVPEVDYDLTKLYNVRNGKAWSFAKTEYTFDKADMSERYQFAWMDDCTQAFDGYPIEVKSNYVSKGKIEDVNVGNFSSDVDLMLLNPGGMSKDGFALLATVPATALFTNRFSYFAEWYEKDGGEVDKQWALKPIGGKRVRMRVTLRQHDGTVYANNKANIRVYKENGYTDVMTIPIRNNEQDVTFIMPNNCKYLTFNMTGYNDVSIAGIWVEDNLRELPFYQTEIDGVTYDLQNGYVSFAFVQSNYYVYDLPASVVEINKRRTIAQGTDRKKKQSLSFPAGDREPHPQKLVKTLLGEGQIEKLSINLSSRMIKATLKYDTEQ